MAPKRSFYVSKNGKAGAEGSINSPLDLPSVLSVNTPAAPGDTIWIREGTYTGPFTSEIRGTEADPIIVRAYPGERVAIDSGQVTMAALTVNGEWTWYADFEVMNSHPFRVDNGTTPGLRPDVGIVASGAHLKFINLLVHDLAGGIDLSADAADNEAYGNLVYFNGWQGKSGVGEGFGIRTPNRTEARSVRENIIFDQFAVGLLAYGSGVDNLTFEGNVLFNNGRLSNLFDRQALIGGGSHNLAFNQNMTYYTDDIGTKGEGMNVGMGGGCSGARFSENYLTGGNPLNLTTCQPTAMKGNTLYGQLSVSDKTYPGNVMVSTVTNSQAAMTGVKVFVRPSQYAPGRATVVIYNWSRAPEVSVDLSRGGLKSGERYEMRDAQNYFATPVSTWTYEDSRLVVPMKGHELVKPVGTVTRMPNHTAPEFAVFVIVPVTAPPASAAR